MRTLLLLAATACLLSASTASAQTYQAAVSLSPEMHSCITERPVPSSSTVTYLGPVTAPPRVLPLAPTTVYQPVRGVPVVDPVAAFRPVLPVVSVPKNYVIGRGIIGQPKLYVPGQPIRNALRWLTL